MPEPPPEHPVILFDGVCNVCNWSVNFIIDRDPRSRFRFASLQSSTARALLEQLGRPIPEGDPESLVVIDRGRVYERSGALVRIAHYMGGAWPLLAALIVIPRPMRDTLYRWLAARRYRWFGKSDTCRIPTPELRARFLA
jgi:predicted DCC family thiol-disulfide oxidoreductase YuxK